MEIWGSLRTIFAQARRNLIQVRPEIKIWGSRVQSRSSKQILAQARLSLKNQLKFFIFAFEILVYYCLLFLSEKTKSYLKI